MRYENIMYLHKRPEVQILLATYIHFCVNVQSVVEKDCFLSKNDSKNN